MEPSGSRKESLSRFFFPLSYSTSPPPHLHPFASSTPVSMCSFSPFRNAIHFHCSVQPAAASTIAPPLLPSEPANLFRNLDTPPSSFGANLTSPRRASEILTSRTNVRYDIETSDRTLGPAPREALISREKAPAGFPAADGGTIVIHPIEPSSGRKTERKSERERERKRMREWEKRSETEARLILTSTRDPVDRKISLSYAVR